ncbi:hypothetical protein [Desulfosporosinus lacus]|uniref:ABC-2 type transport system permease protein n=1 Tax=Desulfosporosinus lacus DSM 15449 TaxID=1121420 RepID=A0A1M6A4G1_9FIRM|nr:hypothetical protein [Desulfosporosinus lacus]SHI31360.1 hypothetical protein SAMN02746098_03889 [Desulfosporosinus lacus DSM 15449]
MLSKLLKYEIKATGRIFLPLFLALLTFAGITRFIYSIGPEKWDTPASISMAIYIIIMVGMFVMTFIMMIQRFYKNLLSDEGYLMLTLPVKPWKHIFSKLLVSMLWMLTSVIVALMSIFIITLEKGDITKIAVGLASFYDQAFAHLGASMYLFSFEIIIGLLITLASGILILYASIALGHLFSKHKMLASFGAFIVLSTLSQILFKFISLVPGMDYFANIHISSNDFIGMQHAIQWAMALGIIYTGLLCAAYFAVTNFILSKRLNLE